MKKDRIPICGLPKSTSIEDRITIKNIYTLFEEEDSIEYYFEGECHAPWEIFYLVSGALYVTADSSVFALSPGDILVLKPMVYHKMWLKDCSSAHFFVCTFDADGNTMYRLQNKLYHTDHTQGPLLDSLLSLLRSFITSAEKWARDEDFRPEIIWHTDFVSVLNKKGEIKRILPLAVKYLELILVSLTVSDYEEKQISKDKNTLLFIQIAELLEKNVYSKITINEIAAYCGVSAATVKNCFSRYAGCSIHKYFLNIKIRTAISLLESGKHVGEVSDLLGFANQNYFSQVFKRETATTPRSHKK